MEDSLIQTMSQDRNNVTVASVVGRGRRGLAAGPWHTYEWMTNFSALQQHASFALESGAWCTTSSNVPNGIALPSKSRHA